MSPRVFIRSVGVSVVVAVAVPGGCGPRSTSSTSPAAAARVAQGEERTEALRRIVEDTAGGRFDDARAEISRFISEDASCEDRCQGFRMLASVYAAQSMPELAAETLDRATAVYESCDVLQRDGAHVGVGLLIDRAQLAEKRDRALAVQLYDQAAGSEGLSELERRIAMVNPVFLLSEMGQYDEALARGDAYLASPASESLSQDDRIGMLDSMASWCEVKGDFRKANERRLELWRTYGASDNPEVIDAAVRVARGYPPPEYCRERLELLHAAQDRVRALRAAHPEDVTLQGRLDELQRDIAAGFADSQGCAGE